MNSRRAVTWVKICGTTSLADAQMSVAAGADALGFIFAPSPRHIDTDVAAEIVKAVSGEVETIGVFVNELPSRIAEIARQVGLSGVQLHGDEAAEQLAEFRRELGQPKIIKALSGINLQQNSYLVLEKYLGAARSSLDAMLLDSGSAERRGGTGVPFDWESAQPTASRIREQMPLIIAGGLNAGNVAQALDLFQPWGVDVVSGVESAPGKKDEGKLRDFMAAVRQHILQ
jgi:phosphoribosylanthranilate isomerase